MKINSYAFGRIVVDGQEYSHDLMIFPDRVFASWWRQKGHHLQKQDLDEILKLPTKPDLLIIGNGHDGALEVPRALLEELQALGIQAVVLNTSEAVRMYNQSPSGRTVAALHLTC